MVISFAADALTLLAVQALLVAVASALRPSGNIYITIIAVSLITAPLAFVSDRLLLGETLGPDGRLFMSLTHLSLGGFLFHFITLPDRSVTLRILVELLIAPGHALSTGALKQRYSLTSMITSRLQQLTAAHFIEISVDRRIRLTKKGLAFGRFVTAGRKLFGIASAN